MKKYLKTAFAVAFFSVLAAALLVVVLIPLFKGYTSYVIMSDSMEPTLSRGDIIQVSKVAETELVPGDIITVKAGEDRVNFTHRILYIDNSASLVYTKGDANAAQDLYPVSYENILGRVVYKIPYLGKIVLLFREGA